MFYEINLEKVLERGLPTLDFNYTQNIEHNFIKHRKISFTLFKVYKPSPKHQFFKFNLKILEVDCTSKS